MDNAYWEKRFAALEALLAVKDQEIAARDREIAQLKVRIAELERRLGLNSTNSSKPPSGDGLAKKPTPKSLRRSGRKPSGGQLGHEGVTLKQVEAPDYVMPQLLHTCPECKGNIAAVAPEQIIRRQVFDIPPPIIEVTEHQAEVKVCNHCQKRVVAAFPDGVNAPVQYGQRVKSLAVYLNTQQMIPEDRLQTLFNDVFNLPISTASLVGMVNKFATLVTPYVDMVKDYLQVAPVKHQDETGFRIGGATNWLHVLSNCLATVYKPSTRRGDIFRNLKGTTCHDHYGPYFKLQGVKHSLCNAHILRELRGIWENDEEIWARKMWHLLHFVGDIYTDQDKVEQYRKRVHKMYARLVGVGLKYHEELDELPQQKGGKKKRRPGHNLLRRLQSHQSDVLRCIDPRFFGVPFSNNQAEQDIRMMKVRQKISGGFRSMEGAKTFATIRSFTSTMRKQGHNLFSSITDAINGKFPQLTTQA